MNVIGVGLDHSAGAKEAFRARELRRVPGFAPDPARFGEVRRRYTAELAAHEAPRCASSGGAHARER
jgi:uncharacterized protein YeaO (DUF488 family)